MPEYPVSVPVKATAYLPDDRKLWSGHGTGMKLQEVLARIERRLDATGLSADAASRAAKKPDAIRNMRRAHQRGRTAVMTSTIDALAHVLGTTSGWLMHGEGAEETVRDFSSEDVAAGLSVPDAKKTVKLKGYVGAGSEAHFYALADEDYEEVEAPRSATDRTVAVEIKGSSFGPLMDSWLVYYDDVQSPITESMIGRICVVGLADDRILIKKIVRNGEGGFNLLSNSNEPPILDVEIEWAARVTDMKPRN